MATILIGAKATISPKGFGMRLASQLLYRQMIIFPTILTAFRMKELSVGQVALLTTLQTACFEYSTITLRKLSMGQQQLKQWLLQERLVSNLHQFQRMTLWTQKPLYDLCSSCSCSQLDRIGIMSPVTQQNICVISDTGLVTASLTNIMFCIHLRLVLIGGTGAVLMYTVIGRT